MQTGASSETSRRSRLGSGVPGADSQCENGAGRTGGGRHIQQYGTNHSEAILTENAEHAAYFQTAVDAAAVYHNASTRFTDGFEFGYGAEIGISTQKLHARGRWGFRR